MFSITSNTKLPHTGSNCNTLYTTSGTDWPLVIFGNRGCDIAESVSTPINCGGVCSTYSGCIPGNTDYLLGALNNSPLAIIEVF